MNINPKVFDIFHLDAGNEHHDTVDFVKAEAAGYRGVIHKATEGVSRDPAYAQRRPRALVAGLLWGAYHFMRPGIMAEHARGFIAAAKPDANTLMAIDHEDPKVSLADLLAFYVALKTQLAAINLKPKIKLYSGFLIKHQIPHASSEQIALLLEMDLWGCQYGPRWIHADENHKGLPWPKVWLWQFTGDGSGPSPHAVPGIQDKMDINSFDGTDAELAEQWAA